MNMREIKKMISSMYDVSNVEYGYWYWFWKLYNIVIDIFEYNGLPEKITKEDIENSLILLGHACVFDRKGHLYSVFSRIYDFDYHYQPTKMVYANPKLVDAHIYTIGEDCEVIYNTSMKHRVWNLKVDSGLYTFIARYARQFADIESTLNIYTVNSRITSYPTADGDKMADSIKAFFNKIKLGQNAVIADDAIINRFRNVDINRFSIKDGVNDWLIARDKVFEQFLRDIGVRMYNPKKAQVNEEEIESNDQMLLISLDDLLEARQEGLERVNNLFGTNISVKINERFDISKNREVVTING